MLPTLWRLEIAKVCAELKPRAFISVGGFAGESPIESLCEIAATTLPVRFVLGFGPSSLRDSVTSLDEALQALQSGAASPKARNLHGPALITKPARVSPAPGVPREDELLAQGAMTVWALSPTRRDVILLLGPRGSRSCLGLISGGALLSSPVGRWEIQAACLTSPAISTKRRSKSRVPCSRSCGVSQSA